MTLSRPECSSQYIPFKLWNSQKLLTSGEILLGALNCSSPAEGYFELIPPALVQSGLIWDKERMPKLKHKSVKPSLIVFDRHGRFGVQWCFDQSSIDVMK